MKTPLLFTASVVTVAVLSACGSGSENTSGQVASAESLAKMSDIQRPRSLKAKANDAATATSDDDEAAAGSAEHIAGYSGYLNLGIVPGNC